MWRQVNVRSRWTRGALGRACSGAAAAALELAVGARHAFVPVDGSAPRGRVRPGLVRVVAARQAPVEHAAPTTSTR